jgi:hypothetical protein
VCCGENIEIRFIIFLVFHIIDILPFYRTGPFLQTHILLNGKFKMFVINLVTIIFIGVMVCSVKRNN